MFQKIKKNIKLFSTYLLIKITQTWDNNMQSTNINPKVENNLDQRRFIDDKFYDNKTLPG